MRMAAGELDRRIRIEKPVADDSFDGAGSGSWDLVATVWANIRDALPSRGERIAEGINAAARPSRVRIRYRADVTPDMRFVMTTRDPAKPRIMRIVSGPAELGHHDVLEFMVEEYRPAGNAA